MYIKTEDFSYFETLHKSLAEEKQKKFLSLLMKTISSKTGSMDIGKIQVVGDDIFDSKGIEPGEFITRIKCVFRPKANPHSGGSRTLIPEQAEPLFWGNLTPSLGWQTGEEL